MTDEALLSSSSADAREATEDYVREIWDAATNTACSALQSQPGGCGCPDGHCRVAVDPSPEDIAMFAERSMLSNPPEIPDDWVLVPREPTDEMYRAATRVTRDDGYGHCHDAVGGAAYRAMIEAAPKPGRR